MPVFWRGNGWFGVKLWTPTSTKIPLESSLQWLSIGAIKTWQFYFEMIRYKFYKVHNSAGSDSFWLRPDQTMCLFTFHYSLSSNSKLFAQTCNTKIGVDYMSSFFDCIKYNLYNFLYMCFLISPYVRLRVPAYLGTRGPIEHC